MAGTVVISDGTGGVLSFSTPRASVLNSSSPPQTATLRKLRLKAMSRDRRESLPPNVRLISFGEFIADMLLSGFWGRNEAFIPRTDAMARKSFAQNEK